MRARAFPAWAIVSVLTVLAVAGFPPAAADHPVSGSGRTVAFDHRTGNEWWVEVLLSGPDAGSVASVEAMDDGGPWVTLTKRSWGAWATSFHIEPGHFVRFRATWAGGAQATSCWFTHPDGLERCAPQFSASFTLVTGNAWWQQTQVTPTSGHTVSAVEVRMDGGLWSPLRLQSWGVREWAGSYYAPQGTIVQFRAVSAAGATALSSCYQWVPPSGGGQTAAVVPCGGAAFDASFAGVQGSNWWIQTQVSANRPIAKVEARHDGGAWHLLARQSWGGWAASYFIPTGAHVQLRAVASDGAVDYSSNGWLWPDRAYPPAQEYPAPSSTFGARFENVRGDQGWVQVNVYVPSSWPVGRVDANVDGGSWQRLVRQPSGDWGGGVFVPDGSIVRFRACADAAAARCEVSAGGWRWPSATPVPSWPQAGSYAKYFVDVGGHGDPTPSHDEINVTLTFTAAGTWQVHCDITHVQTSEDGTQTRTRSTRTASFVPPTMPTAVSVGDDLELPAIGECEPDTFGLSVESISTWNTRYKGSPVTVAAWRGTNDLCGCGGGYWARHQGIVLSWDFVGSAFHSVGRLVDTDAPIV